jgi:hypothetical protein
MSIEVVLGGGAVLRLGDAAAHAVVDGVLARLG